MSIKNIDMKGGEKRAIDFDFNIDIVSNFNDLNNERDRKMSNPKNQPKTTNKPAEPKTDTNTTIESFDPSKIDFSKMSIDQLITMKRAYENQMSNQKDTLFVTLKEDQEKLILIRHDAGSKLNGLLESLPDQKESLLIEIKDRLPEFYPYLDPKFLPPPIVSSTSKKSNGSHTGERKGKEIDPDRQKLYDRLHELITEGTHEKGQIASILMTEYPKFIDVITGTWLFQWLTRRKAYIKVTKENKEGARQPFTSWTNYAIVNDKNLVVWGEKVDRGQQSTNTNTDTDNDIDTDNLPPATNNNPDPSGQLSE